jgi:hypothetical protein
VFRSLSRFLPALLCAAEDGAWPPPLLYRTNSRTRPIRDRHRTRSFISPQEQPRNKLKPDVSPFSQLFPSCCSYVYTFSSVLFGKINKKDYELVRVHHPDSTHSRSSDVPKRIRDERFGAIKDAYDVLTGKKPGNPSRWSGPDCSRDWEFRSELERRRNRQASWGGPQAYAYSQSHCSSSSDGPMAPEDRRRDNILICVAFVVRLDWFHRFSDVDNSCLPVVCHHQFTSCICLVACGIRATSRTSIGKLSPCQARSKGVRVTAQGGDKGASPGVQTTRGTIKGRLRN